MSVAIPKGYFELAVKNTDLRREKDFTRLKIILIFFLVGILFTLGIFLYVWQQVQVIKFGYEINQLKKDYMEQFQVNNNLKIEFSSIRSLEYIESKAKLESGLVFPEKKQVIIVRNIRDSGKSVNQNQSKIKNLWKHFTSKFYNKIDNFVEEQR